MVARAARPRQKRRGVKLRRWRVQEIAPGVWFAENGERSLQVPHGHCTACVYYKVIAEYGGDCDLRGLHRYGACYGLLALLVAEQRAARGADEQRTMAEA